VNSLSEPPRDHLTTNPENRLTGVVHVNADGTLGVGPRRCVDHTMRTAGARRCALSGRGLPRQSKE
jgi:hypothetical protein